MRTWVIVGAVLLVLGILYSALWSSPRTDAAVEDAQEPEAVGVAANGPVAAATAAGQATNAERPAAEERAAQAAAAPRRSLLNPTGVLVQAYESEPRDALWAEGKEKEIREVLSDEQLPDDLLRSASCRTTVCKIEMVWDKSKGANYTPLTKLVGQHWAPSIGIEYPEDSRERRAMNLYIIRKGYSVDDVAP